MRVQYKVFLYKDSFGMSRWNPNILKLRFGPYIYMIVIDTSVNFVFVKFEWNCMYQPPNGIQQKKNSNNSSNSISIAIYQIRKIHLAKWARFAIYYCCFFRNIIFVLILIVFWVLYVDRQWWFSSMLMDTQFNELLNYEILVCVLLVFSEPFEFILNASFLVSDFTI